jgi:type II secretory pathway pseudopilin PulG
MDNAMSFWKRSTRPSLAKRSAGFSIVELLVATTIFGLAITATSGFFLASNTQMKLQARKIETNQAARAAIDTIVRDLRLGGACLPVTGDFISMEGTENGDEDEIVVRTGLVRPDLSCVRTAMRRDETLGQDRVRVETVDGFEVGQLVYLRAPSNRGEYVKIASINPGGPAFFSKTPLSRDYPRGSGVYVVDERRFYINHWTSPRGVLPELMVRIDDDEPSSFAVGIEKLNFAYQLRRNCPPCDTVDLPSNNDEWAIVEQVFVTITARSELKVENDDYYRRTIQVGVKPRNLLPR